MHSKNSTKTSVLLLGMIEILERFSYYGTRALIVLFLIDEGEGGLGLDRTEALSYYGTATFLLSLSVLPMGIISDVYFKQRKGVFYGIVLLMLGYSCLVLTNGISIVIGIVLIIIGTGLFKPNLWVLIGRLFPKHDRKRNFAFLLIYWLINIGSFGGVFIAGYCGEVYGYEYGFAICALSMLMAAVIFHFTKDKLNLRELEELVELEKKESFESPILDNLFSPKLNVKATNSHTNHIGLILFYTLVSICFWTNYGMINDSFFTLLPSLEELPFLGGTIQRTALETWASYITLLTFLLVAIYGYFKTLGSTIGKISLGWLLLGIWGVFIYQLENVSIDFFAIYSIWTFILVSLAEIFISPFLMSYVTRLSGIKYASTIMGLFLVIPYLLNSSIQWIYGNLDLNIPILTVASLSIGVSILLFIFKKPLKKAASGLD